ncbi:MAG: hypothetical protein ACJAT2_000290 [Bacteriovoracaceae bacterium]
MSLDLKSRFNEIADFLKPYEKIYSLEFLKRYPAPYPTFMNKWLLEMRQWDDKKLAELESCPHEDLVFDQDFKDYLYSIRTLSIIPKSRISKSLLPPELTHGLNQKKIHELSLLKTRVNDSKAMLIFDIGGGIGHTSLMAVHGTSKRSVCVDQDLKLLDKGMKKLKKIKGLQESQVRFQHLKIDSSMDLSKSEKNLTIGLHSCGDLSAHVLNTYLKSSHELILFGCCYHKINNSLYLSKESKLNRLELTTNALHLASRSAKKVNDKEILKRKSFKRHRYCLHYFMNDQFNTSFSGIGNSAPKDYQRPFSAYAKGIEDYGELKSIPSEDLDRFYEDKETIELFNDNFNADILRLLLGRLIELYIILDRALYLEEQGIKVKVSEVFDRSLSPRNIMLEAGF